MDWGNISDRVRRYAVSPQQFEDTNRFQGRESVLSAGNVKYPNQEVWHTLIFHLWQDINLMDNYLLAIWQHFPESSDRDNSS